MCFDNIVGNEALAPASTTFTNASVTETSIRYITKKVSPLSGSGGIMVQNLLL